MLPKNRRDTLWQGEEINPERKTRYQVDKMRTNLLDALSLVVGTTVTIH